VRELLPHHIFWSAYAITNRESKHRDDLMAEVEWWLYWMATVYDPSVSDARMLFVGSLQRTPINALLERAYREGYL